MKENQRTTKRSAIRPQKTTDMDNNQYRNSKSTHHFNMFKEIREKFETVIQEQDTSKQSRLRKEPIELLQMKKYIIIEI